MRILSAIFTPKDDNLHLHKLLIKGASGTFVLKVTSVGLGLIISMSLARLLGAAGYGIYAYATAWIGVLGVPALLGTDNLLVRKVSTYYSQSKWGLIRGLLQKSSRVVLYVSLCLMALAGITAWTLVDSNKPLLYSFLVSLLLLPLTAFNKLIQSVMQALHHAVPGQLPEMLIRPLVFIALIGGAYFLLGDRFSAVWAIGLNFTATAAAFTLGIFLLQKLLPPQVKTASPAYKTRTWIRSALPLFLVSGMHVINTKTDIIMLGIIKGEYVSGIYAVTTRGAELITFILVAVNTALGPVIARLYAVNEMRKLQNVITQSSRLILLCSLPAALCFILFGYWFLLMFGPEFIKGRTALAILSTGQLINAASGSVGLILIMTGHGREAALGVGLSAAANVIFNALFIPVWGLEGAATATAGSLVMWNAILIWFVRRRLGLHPTALGVVRRNR